MLLFLLDMIKMGSTQKCLLLIGILASISKTSLAACPKQNLLDDILSPANAERALQILRLASVGANLVNPSGTSLVDPPRCAPSLPSILPAIPAKQVISDFYQRRVLPRPIVSQPILEVAPIPPVITPTVIQEKVYPAAPIPQPCVSPALPVAYPPAPVAYPPPPVAYPPPPVPCPAAPVPLVNPFLPAASPVSALAPPTSSLLPPVVPTQVRSHFLRKIPIPPPSL